MGVSLDEMIARLPRSRQRRIERRTEELIAEERRLRALDGADLPQDQVSDPTEATPPSPTLPRKKRNG